MGAGPRAIACFVAVVLTFSCANTERSDESPTTSRPTHLFVTEEYLPGAVADIYLPAQTGKVALVVMVPGGAWVAADRSGLGPLAEGLADEGFAVANTTHRPAGDGVHFPAPVEDVVCAIGFSVARVRAEGLEPHPVIVLGHSSGAHLAALAVLAADRFAGSCNYPIVAADALVGLAGTYDVRQVEDLAFPLFGVTPTDDPEVWIEGNALTWAPARPTVPVLLAHGDRDELVPLSFTDTFADALEEAGHVVQLEIVPGADHHDIYSPAFIQDRMTAWIRSLS